MALAATSSLPALLSSLSQSLTTSFEATPKLSGIGTSKDGLSLLDVKNELLLSYLQNLVFLILLKTRTARKDAATDSKDASELSDAVVKKLVELRLYLEKGVRPLEDKLRYQIEKVLRAVDDAERQEKAEADAAAAASKMNGKGRRGSGSASGSESEDDSGSEDDEEGSSEDEEEAGDSSAPKITELQYRPNLSAFVRPADADDGGDGKVSSKDGIYRPPKIAPTSMPTMTERRERASDRRKPLRSATMDEFVNDELSAAPVAQPSIGTNIAGRGRHVKTAAERRDEAERQAYEETHFVRLPKEGKKERARKEAQAGGGRMNFGGEEWRGLGEGVDRINKLVQRKDGGGGGGAARTKALLEKSRKRGIETTDGPRGDGSGGVELGERYQKRLKVQERGRTSRGKNR